MGVVGGPRLSDPAPGASRSARRNGSGRVMRRLIAACVIGAAVLAGCAAPRQSLGTRSSPCFRSLPTAKAAVHHEGRLVGVRRLSRATVQRAFPTAQLPPGRDFCVVGFSDEYHAEKVDHAAGAPTGKYAAVIVTMRGTTVVQTYLVDRIPFRLRHT